MTDLQLVAIAFTAGALIGSAWAFIFCCIHPPR